MKTLVVTLVFAVLTTSQALAQSPNERIHVLQKRDYSVKNKIEISLFGGMSIGDVFTQQYSSILTIDYHIGEAFALEAMWLSSRLPFTNGDKAAASAKGDYKNSDSIHWGQVYTQANKEIRQDAALSPSNADLVLIGNYIGLNLQFSPIYGKWTFFHRTLGHADFYLTAGGGLASTEYQLPSSSQQKGDWVDTGRAFVGNFGLGFRIFFSRWFALRIDLRDFTFAPQVSTKSGSDSSDATKIRNTLYFMVGASFLFGGETPVEIWSPYK